MAFSSKFVKIQTLFHKTDTTEVFYSLRSTKPKNFKTKNGFTRPHAKPQSLYNPRPSPSNLHKYSRNFRTRTTPLDPSAKCQNFRPKKPTHAPPELRSVMPLYPRTSMRYLWFSRASTRLQLISRMHAYTKKKKKP